jgi:hypothetical protein
LSGGKTEWIMESECKVLYQGYGKLHAFLL